MLGLRVRVFNGDEEPLGETELQEVLKTFDALVDALVVPTVLRAASPDEGYVILMDADAPTPFGLERERLSPSRSAILTLDGSAYPSWEVLCRVLRLSTPAETFPAGAPKVFGLFRGARAAARTGPAERFRGNTGSMDDSPWVLPPSSSWQPAPNESHPHDAAGAIIAQAGRRRQEARSRTLRGRYVVLRSVVVSARSGADGRGWCLDRRRCAGLDVSGLVAFPETREDGSLRQGSLRS